VRLRAVCLATQAPLGGKRRQRTHAPGQRLVRRKTLRRCTRDFRREHLFLCLCLRPRLRRCRRYCPRRSCRPPSRPWLRRGQLPLRAAALPFCGAETWGALRECSAERHDARVVKSEKWQKGPRRVFRSSNQKRGWRNHRVGTILWGGGVYRFRCKSKREGCFPPPRELLHVVRREALRRTAAPSRLQRPPQRPRHRPRRARPGLSAVRCSATRRGLR
jgi:hypothetical protein